MRKTMMTAAMSLAMLTAACGTAADQNVTTTNDGNVVLNDSQANYAFRGDGEMTNDMAMDNAMTANMTMMNAADAGMAPANMQ